MAELIVCYVDKSVGICHRLYKRRYFHIICFGLCKLCSRIHAMQYQKALFILAETTDVGTERCININQS